jgi:glycosyltransferase involved in cell wall biosynthesis
LEDWVLVRGLIRLFPALALLPDTKWVWKNADFRKCDLLASSNKYDAFISFGQPWTDHLVGLQLKEQTGLPWVAHFSDPWADSPFDTTSSWVKHKRLEMEEAVIRSADAIIFVSKQTADLVMKKYPIGWQQKVHIIPHGFEPLESPLSPTVTGSTHPVEFTYTGNFYGPRSPETLLKAAASLVKEPAYSDSFRLRFVGPIAQKYKDKVKELGLTSRVLFEGPVSFAASQDFCQQADVLLVIDAPSESPSVFLPSKLIDYLAFNKPILGITPLQGASADLIRDLGCPVVDPLDIPGITHNLARYIDNKRSGALALPEQFQQAASLYHMLEAASKLNSLLSSLIG